MVEATDRAAPQAQAEADGDGHAQLGDDRGTDKPGPSGHDTGSEIAELLEEAEGAAAARGEWPPPPGGSSGPSGSIGPGSPAGSTGPEGAGGDGRSDGGPAFLDQTALAEASAGVEAEDEPGPPEPPWRDQFELLWVLAILTFGIGDIVTTWWAVQNGASESNPFLRGFVHGNFGIFILIKGLLLGVAYSYSQTILVDEGHDARFMPVVFLLAGLYLMANNIVVTRGLIEAGLIVGLVGILG